MKALLCKSLDGPEALQIAEIPEPQPGANEISIRVSAAALNFFDTLIVRGRYQNRPPLPFSPGGEISGRIVKLGPDVTGFEPGQRVVAHVRFNGCREVTVASVQSVVAIPDSIADEVAAAIPIAYGTALHGLEDRGRLKPGETVLILGATGGTGLAALEIAVQLGAKVIAAGTSDEKLKICAERGAHHLLNLSGANLREAIRQITAGKGPDVIYDCIGGPYSELALRSIAWGGRFLVIGFATGEIPKIALNLLLLKGCEITGVFWGTHVELDRAAFQAQMKRLFAWYVQGAIRPHIDHIFPLERTAEALTLMESRKIKGKVVIKP